MFRVLAQRISGAATTLVRSNMQRTCLPAVCVRHKHFPAQADDEFDQKYIDFFNRADIDGWDIRQAMNDLQGMDMVPEPAIVIAALKACRRINEFALTVRYLEAVKDKCGPKVNEIWPYMLQEIRPTLDELGISAPEELGFDKPELALKSVYDM